MTQAIEQDGPPPWGLLATSAWTLLSFLVGIVAAVAAHSWWLSDHPGAQANDGAVVSITLLASIPLQVATLAFAAHLRGWPVMDYLGLRRPRRADVVVSLICLGVLILLFAAVLYFTGREMVTPFQIEAYRTAKDAGWLLPLFIVMVLVAPAGEEIVFRGFLYRGWARPGTELYAVAVIAVLFSALHTQYDWVGMLQVFALGLTFGWFRWVSGSTALTILMHAAANLEAMLETVIKVEWLS